MAHTVSAVTLLLALTWPVNSDWSGCPGDTWVRHGNYCYLYPVAGDYVHYTTAAGLCYSAQPGSLLPSIHNREEDNFLAGVAPGYPMWIGLVRCPDDSWHWNDGSEHEVHYTNWASGEPKQGDTCAFQAPGGQWYSTSCLSGSYRVTCQILARDNTLNTGQTGDKLGENREPRNPAWRWW